MVFISTLVSAGVATYRFRADPKCFGTVIAAEHMPGMTGSTLIAGLRRIRENIPIMLVRASWSARVHQGGATGTSR
jgi:hypothetical protein